MNREELLSLLGECERKRQVAKARLLKALSEQETIPYEWITGKLGVSAATVNSIVKVGAAKLVSSESYRNPVKMQSVEAVRNTLSEEQQTIVTEVLADFDAGRRQTYLIHGITGSGKNGSIYAADRRDDRKRTAGYRADPGDRPDVSDAATDSIRDSVTGSA